MEKNKRKYLEQFCQFWNKPSHAYWLGFIVALIATTLEVARGRAENFVDFQDATINFWNGITSYTREYAAARDYRYFIYSPVFNVLFAPFAYLPWKLGAFAYNLLNYSLFFYAIRLLPSFYDRYKTAIFFFLLLILEQSVFCFQYNITVAYCFLFAYALLERNKPFWAVLIIMLSATTKIYGIVQLALLFCYPKVWRNMGYALLCGLGLLMLPAIQTGWDGLIPWYQDWLNILTDHNDRVYFISIFYCNPIDRWLVPNIRWVQGISLLMLAYLFFSRYRHWQEFGFRAKALGVLMGWVILFSDAAETHTYVIALAGYMLCYCTQPKHTRLDTFFFWANILLLGVCPTDVLCPDAIYHIEHRILWLDVYCFALTWFYSIYQTVRTYPLRK